MRELNSFLRKLFFVACGLFLLMGLIPEKETVDNREGFDTEEFDDIW